MRIQPKNGKNQAHQLHQKCRSATYILEAFIVKLDFKTNRISEKNTCQLSIQIYCSSHCHQISTKKENIRKCVFGSRALIFQLAFKHCKRRECKKMIIKSNYRKPCGKCDVNLEFLNFSCIDFRKVTFSSSTHRDLPFSS